MLAAGRNDIWVTGDIWRFPTGLLLQRKLLNWSGGEWHSYTAPASLGSIATDGTGGLWAAEIPGMPTPGTFAHFTRGTWQTILAPLPPSPNPNQVTAVQALTRVLGTSSLWAVAAPGHIRMGRHRLQLRLLANRWPAGTPANAHGALAVDTFQRRLRSVLTYLPRRALVPGEAHTADLRGHPAPRGGIVNELRTSRRQSVREWVP
jgi:hypothetical protein